MLGRAFEMAFKAHAGQVDKSGTAYIGHVARVAAAVEGEAEQVVALLHDTVEDCDTTLEEIAAEFGAEIARAVDAVTKRDHEPLAAYMRRVAAEPLAHAVKLADIADNSDPVRMSQLDAETQNRLRAKYDRALALLAEAAGEGKDASPCT